ncbi:MAG: alpha/beta fold hydrolase [Chloroflexota bacterium]
MPILADTYYHLYEGGNRLSPPVVLMHGIGGSHLDWPPDIRRLPGYRVYAIDLPGHGKSRKHSYQSVMGYGKSVLDWLDAAGLYHAVFVGHSLGSAIALYLGSSYPERVMGLGISSYEKRAVIPGNILEDVTHPSTFTRGVQSLVEQYFHPDANKNHIKTVMQWLTANRPSVLHGDLLACNTFNPNGELSQIHAPTLIVHGEADRFVPLRRAQHLADIIPNARLAIIPGAGYMVALERPQAFAEQLSRFLATISFHPGKA